MENNPFRHGSKPYIFVSIANVDGDGFSDVVNIDVLSKNGLRTTNGGDWCRSDGTLGSVFNIKRNLEKGRIVSVQLQGYKKNVFVRQVEKEMRDIYKNMPCVVLGVPSGYIEVDHKDGRYDAFGKLSENPDDYQPLHKCVNDAKRTHCARCKGSGIRFDAKVLGYSNPQWIGSIEYNGSCIGCYWNDPMLFNKNISKDFKKDR